MRGQPLPPSPHNHTARGPLKIQSSDTFNPPKRFSDTTATYCDVLRHHSLRQYFRSLTTYSSDPFQGLTLGHPHLSAPRELESRPLSLIDESADQYHDNPSSILSIDQSRWFQRCSRFPKPADPFVPRASAAPNAAATNLARPRGQFHPCRSTALNHSITLHASGRRRSCTKGTVKGPSDSVPERIAITPT